MELKELEKKIEEHAARESLDLDGESREAFFALIAALDRGVVRAASPDLQAPGGWRVNPWVKRGILLGFRLGKLRAYDLGPGFRFYDKDTFPLRDHERSCGGISAGIGGGTEGGTQGGTGGGIGGAIGSGGAWAPPRIVPGGSAVRAGSYLGRGVTLMPPCYVNVGAYVDDETLIDSHALVGSCAQIGKRVHLSAAAQIGGVLEPIGALPVVIEDEVLVGGNCGVYEGTIVGRRAVLGAGTVLTASVPLYDAVRGEVHRAAPGRPLRVPDGAVVVPGSRPASGEWARSQGLQLYAPVIVKYRDAATDARATLEEALR